MGYPNYKQEFDAPGVGVARFYDLVINTGLEVQYREFKTGYTRLSNPAVKAELEKDADLAASGATVIWSFAASGATGIGPDPKLLAALNDSDILFEIHWPDEGF